MYKTSLKDQKKPLRAEKEHTDRQVDTGGAVEGGEAGLVIISGALCFWNGKKILFKKKLNCTWVKYLFF